ncbi:trafficking protein particle complex subunit 13 [Cricetulus griseus]|uniref:Trafficking protein particle complex subunit 13 n=1 Tax=Cricetulus griseus TaxID=10029 RepID=A0A9J7GLA5_CRIGR|nr:trafficking protein particle complex subunit 13 [Cricetulus griseus]
MVGHCIDDVIHDKILNPGRVIPKSSVSFQLNVQMFLSKICLFYPSEPLDVKTKFYNSDKDDLFLEVQIENISHSTVFIREVSLKLPEMYTEEALNTLNLEGEDECTFGTRTFLQATEGRHYLYHLQFKEEYLEKARTLSGLMEMGKLEIVWKRELGEMPMLHTVPLRREAPSCGELKLSLEKIPDTVAREEPFQITCKITNCTDKKMKLLLKMFDTTSVRWCGCSGRKPGRLKPGSSLSFTLTLLCLQLGLRSISGIRVIDTTLKTKYCYDDVANVCVLPSMVNMKS